jgi:CCR4-NOT transcription complex subunit 3
LPYTAEIDRVIKKVDEGVELFDDIYEKVYSADTQNQKEKYETELKKEIKKLQRLRDQIKSWISGSEVKDKDQLLDYRRLIETKMEAFKVVEKETKTKTFSKEGLARQEKLDPEEQKKSDTVNWIGEIVEQLNSMIDEKDLEIEQLSSGKGKKTNKNQIEECNEHLASHKFHVNKLEGIARLVRNDRISAETVDQVKEDLEYYVESHGEDEFMMAYDEDGFYDELGLDDLDVVNVDRVTQASVSSKKKDDDESSATSGSKKEKNSKKSSAGSGMIPLTIGRAKVSKKGSIPSVTNEATPTKIGRASSTVSSTGSSTGGPAPVAPAPTPKAPAAPAGGGASMAAVLKRESEERQKAALQAQQQEQARQAELLRQQQQLKQQQEAQRLQQQQQEVLRQQQQQQQQQAAQAEALKRQQAQQQLLEQQQRQQQQAVQQDAAAKQKLLQQQATRQLAQAQQQNVLNVGLSGLSLGNAVGSNAPTAISSGPSHLAGGKDATERYLSALNDSFMQIPTGADNERQKSYTPRNPYPCPSCYPSVPSPIFDNPAVFEKLGTDALFFIFYYAQGTHQQYLAAKELKKQSWRYHKKYMTWFQRHEEPTVTTDEYEQGTYIYFDYETGWGQRIKQDFRFEYSFLEDSLSV